MSRRVIPLTLVGYSVILLYAGWMPMQFAWDQATVAHELREAVDSWRLGVGDLLTNHNARLNVVIFLPVGALLVAAKIGRWRAGRLFAAGVGLSAALSCAIEAGQLLDFNRFTRLHDVWTNTLGGAIGAAGMLVVLCGPVRARLHRLQRRIRGRHALLAVWAIALAMIAAMAWQMRPSLSLIGRQWSSAIWSIHTGLAVWPWHKWVIQWMTAFAAMALMLASNNDEKPITPKRMALAAFIPVALAMGLQLMRLMTPNAAPNLAAVATAMLAAGSAALVAPRIQRRHVELPVRVLTCAAALTTLVAYVGWIATGGGASIPFWGLYRHEFAWGYYSMIRRLAVMAGLSFLIAFYLSLTRPWRLRFRMAGAAGATVVVAAGVEIVRLVLHGTINFAGLGEHVVAAAAGAMVFAALWHILDRRDDQPTAETYEGPERRSV